MACDAKQVSTRGELAVRGTHETLFIYSILRDNAEKGKLPLEKGIAPCSFADAMR